MKIIIDTDEDTPGAENFRRLFENLDLGKTAKAYLAKVDLNSQPVRYDRGEGVIRYSPGPMIDVTVTASFSIDRRSLGRKKKRPSKRRN
jgi:hypothetical protein